RDLAAHVDEDDSDGGMFNPHDAAVRVVRDRLLFRYLNTAACYEFPWWDTTFQGVTARDFTAENKAKKKRPGALRPFADVVFPPGTDDHQFQVFHRFFNHQGRYVLWSLFRDDEPTDAYRRLCTGVGRFGAPLGMKFATLNDLHLSLDLEKQTFRIAGK